MLEKNLANYVLILDDAAAASKRQADKPLYEKYRAHAGLLLALALTEGEKERLQEEIDAHENLWVHSWLTDEAYQKPAMAWRDVADAWLAIKSSL